MGRFPGLSTKPYFTCNVVEIVFICHHLKWNWLDFNRLVFALMRCAKGPGLKEKETVARSNSSFSLALFSGKCTFNCYLPNKELVLSLCFSTVLSLPVGRATVPVQRKVVRKGGEILQTTMCTPACWRGDSAFQVWAVGWEWRGRRRGFNCPSPNRCWSPSPPSTCACDLI